MITKPPPLTASCAMEKMVYECASEQLPLLRQAIEEHARWHWVGNQLTGVVPEEDLDAVRERFKALLVVETLVPEGKIRRDP